MTDISNDNATDTNTATEAGANLPAEVIGALGYTEAQMQTFATLWAMLTPEQKAAWSPPTGGRMMDGKGLASSGPTEDDDFRAAVAALASEQKIKSAYLNVTTIFSAHHVPGHLVTRLHAREQPIPLFYLTNEALAAAANPSSDIFKKIANLNVPLDGSLDAALKTADIHKTLKRFIELWCIEPDNASLDDDELEALDDARRAWIGHLKIVDALVEGTQDAFDERVALAYDMEIRAAAHKIKGRRFDPSIVWEPLKQKVRERIQREEFDQARTPSILRRLHPDAASLLPLYASSAPAASRGGGRAFRPVDTVHPAEPVANSTVAHSFSAMPRPAGSSERRKGTGGPDICFGCGGVGHGIGICASRGRAKAAMRGRELRCDDGNGAELCKSFQISGCTFGGADGSCRPGAESTAGMGCARDPAGSSISPRERVVTPLVLSEWEALYNTLRESLKLRYADVLAAIRGRFDIGIADSETIANTFTATPSSRYSAEEVSVILDYLHEELDAGRVVGPLPQEDVERILGGTFQTSIFKLVDKPGSEKKRFVRDFSSPRRGPLPSINECIATVMCLDDSYYIDLALPMGLSTEAWGSIANLLRNGLEEEWGAEGFRLRNWVDDFALMFARLLGGSRTATNTFVDDRLDRLGLPRRKEKDRPIDPDDPTFPLIRFVWCVATKAVRLLEKKRVKFLARLDPLLNRSMRIHLEPLERVVGSLVHLAHVVPEGKFRLRALFVFSAEFGGNYFASRHPSSAKTKTRPDDHYEGVYGEVLWWKEILSCASSEDGAVCSIGCQLRPTLPDLDAELLSDAPDRGIGILVNGRWETYTLRPGWNGAGGRNLDFAEALGVELAVVALLSLPDGERIEGFTLSPIATTSPSSTAGARRSMRTQPSTAFCAVTSRSSTVAKPCCK
ncbi:hypothetical protein JCM1840_002974 [Sporobolomyces johnsonii]